MLTAFKAAHGYRPLILAWNRVYLWTLEISPLFLQKLSLYLGADQTQKQILILLNTRKSCNYSKNNNNNNKI